MNYGYARVSSFEQTLDLQIDSLKASGCDVIISDKASGSRDDRPGLAELMSRVTSGDVITIWKLDRLSRSVIHLLQTVTDLQARGVDIRSINESLDSRTPTGKFSLVILSAVAQLERDVLRQRTLAGLEAARLRGRVGGRPRAITDEQIKIARQLMANPTTSIAEICRSLKIAKSSFYRIIKPQGALDGESDRKCALPGPRST